MFVNADTQSSRVTSIALFVEDLNCYPKAGSKQFREPYPMWEGTNREEPKLLIQNLGTARS